MVAKKKEEAEFHIGDGKHLTMKQTTTISMNDQLRLMTADTKSISLNVEIKADFDNIPPQYHQLFMQMMQVRYGGLVNIWDNTQPFTPPEKQKKKWYQIFK